MKKILIVVLIAWAIFHPVKASMAEAPLLSKAEQYDIQLTQWIDKLSMVESGNRESIIIKDTDGNFAYSCLQFHMGTFQSYTKKYGLSGEIGSCISQKKLAKTMIKDNYKNWKHWYNSVTKNGAGYPPKIEDL